MGPAEGGGAAEEEWRRMHPPAMTTKPQDGVCPTTVRRIRRRRLKGRMSAVQQPRRTAPPFSDVSAEAPGGRDRRRTACRLQGRIKKEDGPTGHPPFIQDCRAYLASIAWQAVIATK